MSAYSLHKKYHNSWHVKHNNEVIAHIEAVEKTKPDGTPVMKGIIFKKPVLEYLVTNLPGASDKKFLTLHSAQHHVIHHHKTEGHKKSPHPLSHVKKGITDLERAIWRAASDPRMTDRHQEKLLDVSKKHAELRNTFNKHYGDEKL